MSTPAYWILRYEQRILTLPADVTGPLLPFGLAADFGLADEGLTAGQFDGYPCRTADIATLPAHLALEATPLRALFPQAGDEVFALAGRAVQLLDWQQQHRYCGRCGTPNTMKHGEWAMQCPSCGLLAYPRISPAIMVLVRSGQRLLLARSPHFKPGVFSALAGFVEPGETLEQCAAREVREEVGIEITQLRYFGSQPWPFPNSLMVAFLAEHAGGEIKPDPAEIEAADWFGADALPLLPDPVSISRRLIEAALAGH